MKNNKSLIVHITSMADLDKITSKTKYISLDLTHFNSDVLSYFINNGQNYFYSEIIDDHAGYIYVSYEEFVKAETVIDMIYANMPDNLTKLETARYLYISIAKLVSSDINISPEKTEYLDLTLLSNIGSLWGSLSIGRVNDISAAKIYYYLCKRLDLDVSLVVDYNTKEALNKLNINNQILLVDLYKDLPYIQSLMQTKNFATYNDDIELDHRIKYIKNKYNDYYLDKSLKNIDYTKEGCVKDILSKTESILPLDIIKPAELAVIYQSIFDKYCPNYDIKINNLYLNDKTKLHFLIISYQNNHYSYNYREKTFVKVNEIDILNNLKEGKIGLYQNELIPNINF